MSEALKKQFTNDTLEEELRVMLVDKNNECNALRQRVSILEQTVAEEQEAKYRAYIRVADLQKEAKSTQVHPTQ
jgi:hypothetical protein|tara:strand:+ start:225 stop:446 length:222 start_codon:yes stop_codon:yes gene_type:complete